MENMSEEIVVEDYMLEEIDTMKYYLSKEEFEDTMLHLEDHKPKFITVRKPIEFVTINRRVSNYSNNNFNEFVAVAGKSCSSSTCEKRLDLCKRKQLAALQAIEEYYDPRGLKRKLGFAGLGNDEDCRQRKKIAVEADTYNLDILADACCSVDAKPKLVIRLKVMNSPAAENRSEIAEVKSTKTSRKIVKVKKGGKTGKTKKVKDTRKYDVPVVDVLPAEYREKIRQLNGRNEQLIEQKSLTASDISPNQCRLLLIQKNFVIKPEFLTDDEEKKIAKKDEYITAKLLEPMGCYQEISVKKWNMNHNCYNTLLKPWKDVAASNGFGVDDVVQVWTFRFDDDEANDKLGVAIVRIFTAPRESSTTSSSSSLCSS